jgi:hypothetical protein
VLAALLVLGTVGLVVVLAGLLLGELLDGAVDVVVPGDLGPGATPALGAALAAFGFGGALALRSAGLSTGTAVGLGAAGAVVVGFASYRLSRALIGDGVPPPGADALYGVFGAVVTAVPVDGYGEASFVVHGTRRKLSARAERALPAGTRVYVLDVLSATSVLVAPADPTLF